MSTFNASTGAHPSPDATPSLREGLLELVYRGIGLGVVALLMAPLVRLVLAENGHRRCMKVLEAPLAGMSVVRSTWVRSDGAQWAVAMVAQPRRLDLEPFTFVCRFDGTSVRSPRSDDVYAGDRLDAFAASTRSLMHPLTWGEW